MGDPVRIFASYAREDEPLVARILDRVRREWPDSVEILRDRDLAPGDLWRESISAQIERAGLVLLFVSHSFLVSLECRREMHLARSGHKLLIPIVLHDCAWNEEDSISSRNLLPRDGRPVSTWSSEAEAIDNIVRGLERVIARRRASGSESDIPSPRSNIPRPELFLGRETMLSEVAKRLDSNGSVVSLCGLPGSGKSALALELAHRNRINYPGGTWWLEGSKEPVDQLIALADLLRIEGPATTRGLLKSVPQDLPRERQVAILLSALRAEPIRSLFVVDGVDRDDWKSFLPEGRADVLITTFDERFAVRLPAIRLAGLETDEAIQLSNTRAPLADDTPAEELASRRRVIERELQSLPLAVNLVSSLVHDVGERWSEYEAKLAQNTNIESRLDAIIDQSLARASVPESAAGRFIDALSRFASASVRVEWVAKVAEVDPRHSDVDVAIQRLVELALVRVLRDPDRRLVLHPLVWKRARARAQLAADHWQQLSLRMAGVVTLWHEDHLDFATLREVDVELAHVREAIGAADDSRDALLQTRSRNWLASHMAERADYQEALRLLQEAQDISTTEPSAAREKFVTLTNLGAVYVALDRLEEAETVLRVAERMSSDLPQSARSAVLGNLGIVLRRRGHLVEAKQLLEESLRLRSQLGESEVHRDHHLERLLGALAAVEANLGNREQGLRYAEEAVETAVRRLGPSHRNLVDIYAMRGGLLVELGRIAEGAADLQGALRIAEDEYGPHHPELYFPLIHLANARRLTGDYAGAKLLIERSVEIARGALGADHPMTIHALVDLGVLESESGDPRRAIDLLEQARALDRQRPDQTGEDRAAILNNLGAARLRLGELEAARAYFDQAREEAVAELGESNPRVAMYDANLAFALKDTDPEAALRSARRATRNAWHRLNELERAKILTPIGIAHVHLKRPKKALAALGYARSLFEENLGYSHPSLATALSYESEAAKEVDAELAERLGSRAAEIATATKDLSALISENSLSPDAAGASLSQELEDARARGDWGAAARVALALGRVRLACGASDSARESLKNAVRFAERASLRWTLADAHLMLGHAYELAGLDEQARASYFASAATFARLGGVHGHATALLKLWGVSRGSERAARRDELMKLRKELRSFRKLKSEVDRILGVAQDSTLS